MASKPGERKAQIIQSLADMLEQPRAARITTAALAAHMQLSEAALYRHFASKAQMFDSLIEAIETTLANDIQQIKQDEPRGLAQVRRIIATLIAFAEENRGMTRVLTGDALVTEDPRLQERLNHIDERIQASLKQSLRTAISDGGLPERANPADYASLLTHFVLGRWLRYAHSGWRAIPSERLDEQLDIMLR